MWLSSHRIWTKGLDLYDAIKQPVHPFQCGELDSFEVLPWSSAMDDFGFVETVDRFGESIVVAVANTSDGRLDASFCQSLGVAN